jgi:hypothetical protein
MDYSQSNVVTFAEYLDILKKNNCKGNQRKKANKWLKRVANLGTILNQTAQKVVEKHIKTQYVAT